MPPTDTFSTSSEIAEWNWTKIDRKQDLNVLYLVCIFRPTGKTRWSSWFLNGRNIFNFSYETAAQNSTKLSKKQDFNVHYQVWGFPADVKKMAALSSEWLRHFRRLWNCLTECNKTAQEARYQCSLKTLWFLGRLEKQDSHPASSSEEKLIMSHPIRVKVYTVSSSQIQRNLTGSKNSSFSTKFVVFPPMLKTRWQPQRLIGWDIVDFSFETAERHSRKLDRKQELNSLNQVVFFRPIGKTRWPL